MRWMRDARRQHRHCPLTHRRMAMATPLRSMRRPLCSNSLCSNSLGRQRRALYWSLQRRACHLFLKLQYLVQVPGACSTCGQQEQVGRVCSRVLRARPHTHTHTHTQHLTWWPQVAASGRICSGWCCSDIHGRHTGSQGFCVKAASFAACVPP